MAFEIPYKLIEINVISAQDLPPVSKMLRTFAVAWINTDHKLSTRIDHQGHTNPTWNYKLVFRVEDRFLLSDTAAVTIEIYNVAWLRDLPIGTAHLMINQISPPLIHNNASMRTLALQIRRPSGHLRGILNVGINIFDNGSPRAATPSELSVSSVRLDDRSPRLEDERKNEEKIEKKESSIDEKMMGFEEEFNRVKTGNSILLDSRDPVKIRPKAISSVGSTLPSGMKPLPSEVANNLKKGIYSSGEKDYGSSIFDNWTEGVVAAEESGPGPDGGPRTRSVRWISFDEKTPISKDRDSNKKLDKPRPRRSNSEGGLFSCFGKGFEFTFICGSTNMKKNRKQMIRSQKKYHHSYTEDDLRRFYE